jgi:hypothetical protein
MRARVQVKKRRSLPGPASSSTSPSSLSPFQHVVADHVPETVVDGLELIDVHEHDRHTLVAPPPARPGEGPVETVEEQGAVRESGQRILQRQAAQLLLHPLLLVDVGLRAGHPGGALRPRRPHRQPPQEHPAVRTVRVPQPVLGDQMLGSPGEMAPDTRFETRTIVRMHAIEPFLR